ncbi:MAG: hypothetical protein IKE49_04855 [Firmicutes bacterium]|nr:hypothetical protein [Bacillota bacterium]
MKSAKRKMLTALVTAVLLLMTTTGAAFAYFSDYDIGYADLALHLKGQTVIDEQIHEGDKTISIKNTGNAAVVTRVRIIGTDMLKITFDDQSDWEQHGNFYYYTKLLAPGANTSAINAKLSVTEKQAEMIGDTFDIIVVHDSAPAVFGKNNKVKKPKGWEYIPDIKAE